jgi:hypothetical protein
MSHPNYLSGGTNAFSDEVRRGYNQDVGKITASSSDYKPVSTQEGLYYYEVKPHKFLPSETMQQHLGNRKMTDACCSCVFFAFWIGVGFIMVNALENGDPRRLYHGFDYKGNLCGVDAAVIGKNYLYWPDQNRLDVPICVRSCPISRLESMTVPRESIVTTGSLQNDYVKSELLRENTTVTSYPTRKVGDRLCLPINGTSRLTRLTNVSQAIVAKEMYSSVTVVMDLFKDVCTSWAVLFFMVPVAMACGYLYMFLVRYCAKMILLGFMVALISGFGSLAVYLSNLKGQEQE